MGRSTIGLGVLAATLTAALLAGCGVPTQTGVQVDGPVAETGLPGGYNPHPPPGPDEADSPRELVDYFLQAAAGDPVDAVEQLRPFIHSDHAAGWQPDQQVVVVRVEDDFLTPAGPGRTRVRLDVRLVGTLRDGMIEPRASSETRTHEFEVATEMADSAGGDVDLDGSRTRYRIIDPPNVVLLWDRALAAGPTSPGYLLPSPVYFWDRDRSVLVPDLRWLPTALPAAQRVQTKLEWLIGGPAPWLDSLASLPGEVALEGNVVWEDRLNITFTPGAADLEPGLLDPQLWWTLRGELRGEPEVWLAINGHEREVLPNDAANPAVRPAPASFVVLDGTILPYVAPTGSGFQVPEGGLDMEIEAAAISRQGVGALVHLEDGRYRLSLVTGDGVLATGPTASSMSRPVWLDNPSGIGLVAADGALHRFHAGSEELVAVSVPGLSQPITAMAVAPDGRRLALVAGGDLYVASLVRREDGSVSVNGPLLLPTTASDLAGVAFLQESWLAVVGQEGGRSLLYELTVDGALERPLTNGDLGVQQAVTHVVGYPGNPQRVAPQRGELMFEADGHAYRYRGEVLPITPDELDVDPEAVVSPPRAPLFVE
jgi:hypothetical protein